MDYSSKEQLTRIFARACDGRLTADEEAQLAELLMNDSAALVEYEKFCRLEGDLFYYARERRAERRTTSAVAQATPIPTFSLGSIALGGGIVASIGAFILTWLWYSGSLQQARQLHEGALAVENRAHCTEEDEGIAAKIDDYVARIVRVSPNVVWGKPSAELDFFLRVRPGDKLNVAQGLVQVEFFSGAKLILHGPTTFVPTGPAAGHLEAGRLTGEVTEGDFHLLTPSAEVIDLGTEFGVLADPHRGTDVVVFNGKVQVVSRPETSRPKEVLDMTQGMAARIRSDGTAEYGVETEAVHLLRSVPAELKAEGPLEISLVDVLCGGDGIGKCLSGATDPTSGKKDVRGEPGPRQGNGKYHIADWHSIIDGVFVPPGAGGRVQIDSLGGSVVLPRTNNLTWGPLWARRWDTCFDDTSAIGDFWSNGTLKGVLARLKETHFGIVGMHANVGVTIDLRAVQLLQRASAARFHAIVTNLDNSDEIAGPGAVPDRGADLRVFVDGQERFSRLRFTRYDGDAEIDVDLQPGDRFLTIISSDSTGQSSYDHVVLIDPVIDLKRQPQDYEMVGRHVRVIELLYRQL
jgi:hypothetical protein